ncbi:MAG: undecaprenyl/decaprenyl-phosphate alpha-N-acetylglucosaminyl 1-phosphate transferase [Alphaproteobacteria bacterium]|nr:undecaprenyl/decaprenyl-phosphate alpha-N-acetylglucosaminyl 1-phosphate transferase [Alphaproteobacteria bacterium]
MPDQVLVLALFAVVLAALSAVTCRAVIRLRILDVPNQRSSHAVPVPNGGGIGIGVAILFGAPAVAALVPDALPGPWALAALGVAALGVAAVGLADDLRVVRSFRTKLLAQIAAAGLVIAAGLDIGAVTLPVIGRVELGAWGILVTLVWLVGLTNAFNFMDGLDGLAGGTALVAAIVFGIIAHAAGAAFPALLALVIAAAVAGFLVLNRPPARIFMGDVGSQFLGFLFACLAILAANGKTGTAEVGILVMPLLFLHFICDTSFTLARRLAARENVTRAHRGHLYQLLNRAGWSHARVSVVLTTMAMIQGVAAWSMVTEDAAPMAFGVCLLIQAVYAVTALRIARRAGLLGG